MSAEQRTDRDEIRQALQTILASQTFSRSERLRSFLKFVVEMEQLGRGHQLKGYTIGVDVFSRDEAFNPGTDPLVRVQAGKLRRLLNQFYADEGRNQQLRIRIPLGGYVPLYERAVTARRSSDQCTLVAEQPVGAGPRERSTLPGPTSAGHLVRALPRLFFEIEAGSDWRGDIFCNAVRLWADRLWGVSLAALGDSPEPRSEPRSGNTTDLFFVLEVKTDHHDGTLQVKLRHVTSGQTLAEEIHPQTLSGTVLQLGALANQYTGSTLTLPGHLYQFCQASGLSSQLMQCLDATYRYALLRTDDAYQNARSHQQRWVGLSGQHDIVTEIPKLLALTAFRG
ncbi:hypothetical protein [Rhizobium sp. SL42]|uniref:hypothetical protein n=1 Tax=Rhizobium sp. SL42 TaxID=2806346 RepID=UPI001F32C691|nr:hypothetical protein [Rhizobium sp. SL42]UJW74073.1 hypothetical protein IM739_14440 [Rhizobium sp. SL42]